jgi:hypothetical protein
MSAGRRGRRGLFVGQPQSAAAFADLFPFVLGQRSGGCVAGPIVEDGEDIPVDEIPDPGRGYEVFREAVVGGPPVVL